MAPETADPRHCYVCKQEYSVVHHFYDRLCPSCGDFNFAKRTELADMGGRLALLSGGRVKIGYQADGIHMNSVDTGWVTDEDAADIAARKTLEQRFHPPLDIVDGAARVLDPVFTGMNTGVHGWGQFLKDYRPADW